MNKRDFDGIYQDASSSYQAETSQSDSDALFSAVARKLGDVRQSSQQTMFSNVNSSGSYIRATFLTQFAGDDHATETIEWHSWGGGYHLQSYKIDSLPLITK